MCVVKRADAASVLAKAQAREAVAAYQELLRDYPDYAARDAALYQLARASEVAGDFWSSPRVAATGRIVAEVRGRRGTVQSIVFAINVCIGVYQYGQRSFSLAIAVVVLVAYVAEDECHRCRRGPILVAAGADVIIIATMQCAHQGTADIGHLVRRQSVRIHVVPARRRRRPRRSRR